MKAHNVACLLVVVGTPVLAGDTRAASEPASKLLAEFRKVAKVQFNECADEKCIDVALGSCSPAHLLLRGDTVEGTHVTFDFFVVAQPKGCRVVKYSDFTKDYWGGCRVLRMFCPSMNAARSDDPDRLGCSPTETLYKASACKNPMKGP